MIKKSVKKGVLSENCQIRKTNNKKINELNVKTNSAAYKYLGLLDTWKFSPWGIEPSSR